MRSEPKEDFPSGELSSLSCSCCYEVLLLPTTLTCGHSFCRLCLAQWYLTCRKKECPQCRQKWEGNPQVNITLRDMVEDTMTDRARKEEREAVLSDNQAMLYEFDKMMSSENSGQSNVLIKSFCCGIFFTLLIIAVFQIASFWKSYELYIHKPVSKWIVKDVVDWMANLGTWTEPYVNTVLMEKIDGNYLLALDNKSMVETFNITVPTHQRAFYSSLSALQLHGRKMPSNLWEYKALHQKETIFLLYGMKDFPRTVIMYLYIFEYDFMFIPFVHLTCPRELSEDKYGVKQFLPPTSEQLIEFLTTYFVFPYWVLAIFTLDWTGVHYWTSRFVLLNCFLMTLLEAANVNLLKSGGWQSVKQSVKRHLEVQFLYSICILLYPVIPSIVYDSAFYMALYVSPFLNIESLYKILKN